MQEKNMTVDQWGFYYPATLIFDAEPQFRYAREPVIRRMPDNSLFCTFLTGGPTEPHNDNVVVAVTSDDDGMTWSQPITLFKHSARGLWSTELFTEATRPILFIHTYDAPTRYREITSFMTTTADSGKTWSEPVSLPSGVSHVSVRQGIVLSSGAWLFPVYWQDVLSHWDWIAEPIHNGFQMAWPTRCGVIITNDCGNHFTLHGDLRADNLLFENNVIEVEPGHLVMLIRAHYAGCLYRSDSYDAGVTWTEARPTTIENPSSKLSLTKVRSSIILVHNPSLPADLAKPTMADRTPLSVWVSHDGMHSWARKIDLAPTGKKAFYPHVFADDNSETLFIACEDGKKHYLLKLPYADLMSC